MSERASSKTGFSAGRRFVIALNALAGLLALLAIVVLVNYLASGHVRRFQWARNSPFKLSPLTVKVLSQLTNEVSATIFFDPQGEEDIYALTLGLLTEYQNANPRLIHVKRLDYTRFPGEARALQDRLHLGALKENDFVVIEANGRSKVFYARQLADYSVTDLFAGHAKVRRSAFEGEKYFTSAIFSLSYPRASKSYFIYGHGEGDPGDPSGEPREVGDMGYSKLAAILKDEINSDWQRLDLEGASPIPADCQLLIIAGPRKAQFATNEVEKVEAYLKQGGRLLLLLDTPCGLLPLMSQWGVTLGKFPVIEGDPHYRVYGDAGFLTAEMAAHPITNPLNKERLGLLLLQPHPIVPYGNAAKHPGGPEVTVLADSSPLAVNGGQSGEFPLICAIEQGVVKDLNARRAGGTRLLVAGDPYFLDDQMIDTCRANHYFANLALSWLVERNELLLSELGSWPIKEYKLELTGAQTSQLRWLFLGVMPGSVLFVGGLVWLRRRS